MPTRKLKESICRSEEINKLTWFEEVFFYRLIVCADDFGRMEATPESLKQKLFPKRTRLTHRDIHSALMKLTEVGIVDRYEVDGKPYLSLTTWTVHQTPRAKKSKCPDPPKNLQTYVTHMRAKEERSPSLPPTPPILTSKEEDIYNTRESRFTPPSVEDVASYCRERRNGVDPEVFVDFYTSKGWYVGKNKMKDWQAAVRTWEMKDRSAKPLHTDPDKNLESW